MADKQVVDYLKSGVAAGHPLESLKRALIKSGWDPRTVEEAAGETREKKPVKRPALISFMAIVGWLVSVIFVLFGLMASLGGLIMGAIVTSVVQPFMANMMGDLGLEAILAPSLITWAFFFIGVLIFLLGLLMFWGFYKLWKMDKKGWYTALAFEVLTLLLSLKGLSISGLAVSGGLIGYLWIKRSLFT